MKGWIKLYRKILENPIVCQDCEYFTVWVYLLMSATHESYPMIFRGEKVDLKPGQLITSRKSISSQFKISESKVQRILKKFESEHQIMQDCTNQNRLISIVNWEKYQQGEQQSEQQLNKQRSTNKQPVNTNKNKKNDKNTKNDIYGEYCQTNIELLQAFRDWEEMRNQIKKPLTDKSRRLSIVDLEGITTEPKKQMEILNHATLRCWYSFNETKVNAQKENKNAERKDGLSEADKGNAYDYEKYFK